MKDAFAKKFFVPGEIPLAARSHRFFGNTLLKAGHLMRSSVVSGTVRGLALQGEKGLAAPIQNGLRRFKRIKACSGKPTSAATLNCKGYFGQWQEIGRAHV